MNIESEKELNLLQVNYERAKGCYLYLHKEMLRCGFAVREPNIPEINGNFTVTSSFIVETVEDIFKCKIKQKTRAREVMRGRHAAVYILDKYTKLNLISIAKLCGQNDHTSALHSKRTCVNWMNQDYKYRTDVDRVENLIRFKMSEDQN